MDTIEKDNNKYSNGKIYCLRSHQTDKIYIGSTIQPLYKRFYYHKIQKTNELSNYDDVYIELIEEYPCKNRMELCKKEGEHIRANDCINKRVAGRTRVEHYIDNKDKIKQYYIDNKERTKQYYIDNKDKLNEKAKQRYLANKVS